jgi:hypothetical protein
MMLSLGLANVWWKMNPIYDPIFQLSNIPTFQCVACRRFMDKAMIACLVLRLRRIRVGYWVDFQP